MSVIRKQKVQSTTAYGDTGIVVNSGLAELEVEYTIATIDNFDGKNATGVFLVKFADVLSNERFRFMFPVDSKSKSSLFEQAESQLEAFFIKQDEIGAALEAEAEAEADKAE